MLLKKQINKNFYRLLLTARPIGRNFCTIAAYYRHLIRKGLFACSQGTCGIRLLDAPLVYTGNRHFFRSQPLLTAGFTDYVMD